MSKLPGQSQQQSGGQLGVCGGWEWGGCGVSVPRDLEEVDDEVTGKA